MTPDTPTDHGADDADSTGRPTMGGIDHTHPDRNTTFGSIFGRGPSVAADGGEPTPASEDAADEMPMADVDHEAPSDTGANATFERGAEHGDAGGRESTDVAEEATDE